MKLEIRSPDPLGILGSTQYFVENAKFVRIDQGRLKEAAKIIGREAKKGTDILAEDFNMTGKLENDIQLVFVENTINFCYWSDLNKPRFSIEYPKGNFVEGGWWGMVACFRRALDEKVPMLDARCLSQFDLEKTKHFFRSANDQEIPLMEKRVECLREAGKVLLEKFDGKFNNVLKEANYNAIELVRKVYKHFPLFRDEVELDNRKVLFLKRAQIIPNDLVYLEKNNLGFKIKDIDQLTIFADYKIPQILRSLEATEYNKELASKVDSGVRIKQGSREEIEIRASAIWSVELIRQELNGKFSANQIDNTLWLISQNKKENIKPYHRTRTIFY